MSIRINGKKYINGTVVRANPVEETTGTLNKIGIGSDVYEIQGGGGGGSSTEPIIEVLFDTPQSTSAWANPVSVSCNPLDYDLITFEVNDTDDDINNLLMFTPQSVSLDTATGDYTKGYKLQSGANTYLSRIENAVRMFTSTGTTLTLNKVVGYRFCGALQPVIYSEKEREIGVWKDNKPLYQKTIMVDSITHTGEIDVSSLNIDTVVKMNGIAKYPDNQWVNFPFYHNDNYYIRVYYIIDGGGDISDNCIYFEVGNSARGVYTNGFLTLQYTKTTDVPGSGQYNTLGVPTIHYSTDEQVIGTDYDGKPIYQKTYTNLGTIYSSTNIDLQLSNISWITVDPANSSLNNYIPFPYVHPNTDNMVGCFFDMNGGSPIINCRAGSDASGTFTLDKLTVRYKKTTD